MCIDNINALRMRGALIRVVFAKTHCGDLRSPNTLSYTFHSPDLPYEHNTRRKCCIIPHLMTCRHVCSIHCKRKTGKLVTILTTYLYSPDLINFFLSAH